MNRTPLVVKKKDETFFYATYDDKKFLPGLYDLAKKDGYDSIVFVTDMKKNGTSYAPFYTITCERFLSGLTCSIFDEPEKENWKILNQMTEGCKVLILFDKRVKNRDEILSHLKASPRKDWFELRLGTTDISEYDEKKLEDSFSNTCILITYDKTGDDRVYFSFPDKTLTQKEVEKMAESEPEGEENSSNYYHRLAELVPQDDFDVIQKAMAFEDYCKVVKEISNSAGDKAMTVEENVYSSLYGDPKKELCKRRRK